MIELYLHGKLGEKYGSLHKVHVKNLCEVFQFMTFQLKGFKDYISDKHYRIVKGEREVDVEDVKEFVVPLRCGEVHIVPVVGGAGSRGLGKALVGVALIAVALSPGFQPLAGGLLTKSRLATFGFALALGGVGSLLAPTPPSNDNREVPRNESSLFRSGQNSREGDAIPVVYGRVRVPGMLISSEVIVDGGSNAPPSSEVSGFFFGVS